MKQLRGPRSTGALPAPLVESYWPESYAGAAPVDRRGADVPFVHAIRRHWIALLVYVMLGGSGGVLMQMLQTPVYEARASIEVQPLNENFLNMRDLSPTAVGGVQFRPDYDIQTQVKVLQSAALIERVLEKLAIRRRFEAPGKSGMLGKLARMAGLDSSRLSAAPEDAASIASRGLKVRAQPNTKVVEVLYDSTDPVLAAGFANTLTTELIEYNLQTRWATARRTGDWLASQMRDVRVSLERAEQELSEYARANGLVLTSERTNLSEQKLRQLQEELLRAEADRIARQSKNEMATTSSAESVPEALDDGTVKEYQTKLTDLRRQYAELAAALTPLHPRVQKIDAQIVQMEAALSKAHENIIHRIKNEFEAARRREVLLGAGYARQARVVSDEASKMAHYDLLKRQVDTMRQLHESMMQRVTEASVASALRASNIQVIDVARAPRNPYKPILALNMAFGLLGGLLLGACWAGWRDHRDRSIREPGDTAAFLNLSELAVIPAIAEPRRLTAPRSRLNLSRGPILKLRASESDELGDVGPEMLRPGTVQFAESIRNALTSLLLAGRNGERPRTVVISSPLSNEGKTTIASNLAIALAEINERVLLIDGDLLRPRVHEIFKVENKDGLGDVLAGRVPFVPLATPIPNLYLLPSGAEGGRNALYTPLLPALLRRIRDDFGTILIDAPPLLQAPDARVLGRSADAMILVVRSGKTTRDALQQASERLAEDSIPLLGTILNGWDGRHSGYYAYRHYYGRTAAGAGRG